MKPRLSLTGTGGRLLTPRPPHWIDHQFTIFLAMQSARVIRWACRSPRVSVPASFLIVVWFAVGSHAAFAIALAATLGLLCWGQLDRDRFNRIFESNLAKCGSGASTTTPRGHRHSWLAGLIAGVPMFTRSPIEAHQHRLIHHRLGVSMLPGPSPGQLSRTIRCARATHSARSDARSKSGDQDPSWLTSPGPTH